MGEDILGHWSEVIVCFESKFEVFDSLIGLKLESYKLSLVYKTNALILSYTS